jgi:hypothetical protein
VSVVSLDAKSTENESEDNNSNNNNNKNQVEVVEVQVGSKEYYSGFVSRKINEEPEERITGDAVLIPTLKFVGGFGAILLVLTFAFLASNDLL